jgi:hypothetical protein
MTFDQYRDCAAVMIGLLMILCGVYFALQEWDGEK